MIQINCNELFLFFSVALKIFEHFFIFTLFNLIIYFSSFFNANLKAHQFLALKIEKKFKII